MKTNENIIAELEAEVKRLDFIGKVYLWSIAGVLGLMGGSFTAWAITL